jgi:hypothetical protein
MSRRIPCALMAGLALAGLALAARPMPAAAQSGDRSGRMTDDNGRYTLKQIGDKFIRLDSRTGAVSQCTSGAVGWTCNAVPDERAALESEIERLQKENAALKQSLLGKGIDPQKPAITGRKDDPSSSANEPRLPTDADIDRAMAFMKKVWRRLVEMMADMQRDMKKT